MIEQNRRAKLQSGNQKSSKKDKQERKPRRAVDRSIEEWEVRLRRKRVPELVITLAKVLAYSADDFWRFFHLQQQSAFVGFSKVDPAQWESFYRDPRIAGTVVYRSLSRSLGAIRRFAVVIRLARRKWARSSPIDRGAWVLSLAFNMRRHFAMVHGILKELQAELRTPPVDAPAGIRPPELPEIQFIATVWFPAMFLMGTSPTELLRRAEAGDRAALFELVRLDPYAKLMPALIPLQRDIIRGNRADDLKALELAQAESIDVPNRRGRYKIGVAAVATRFSHKWCEISGDDNAYIDRTDMWNLFDLIGQQRGMGNDSDDLPDFEAYKRAVDRHAGELPMSGWDIFLW